jgi:hypothetical protein
LPLQQCSQDNLSGNPILIECLRQVIFAQSIPMVWSERTVVFAWRKMVKGMERGSCSGHFCSPARVGLLEIPGNPLVKAEISR